MKRSLKQVNDLLGSQGFTVIGTVASVLGFAWFLYDKVSTGSVSLWSKGFLTIAVTLFASAFLYSILVRAENRALRDIATYFQEINELYRDTLLELFGNGNPITNPEDLLDREERVLTSVCQRIEKIFTRVMYGRPCIVTVKLVIHEENGKQFAHSYVRSEIDCTRDKPKKIPYEIGTGENSAFDEALRRQPNGKPPHFFSADLSSKKAQEHYRNQRQGYTRFYKSALVVPIMSPSATGSGNHEVDHVGYLCVDTKSTNWLNDGYHLQIMTSLANQMYNFTSLMRGKYIVAVRE